MGGSTFHRTLLASLVAVHALGACGSQVNLDHLGVSGGSAAFVASSGAIEATGGVDGDQSRSIGGSPSSVAPSGGRASGGVSPAGGAPSGGASAVLGGATGVGGGATMPEAWLACTDSSECVLREKSCCPGCGVSSAEDGIAVNRAYEQTVFDWLCPNVTTCPEVPCVSATQYVVPVCRQGRCQAVDIRADDELTGCTSDQDCQARFGVECCGPCHGTGSGLVAVAALRFDRAVCPPAIMATCGTCIGVYYPHFVVSCDGHCQVTIQ